ncbi:MAG TPA: putative O-glycosylation ligase, exosortase A system-associated, partial [Candidatus Eisenbacteria bacterium]|nr:putative O-glycosylation ligase, exosortase A system-associated [Candidatus Eisenbacteria bacterium]
MSVRDLVVILAYVLALPFAFTRPWTGMLLWSWISYMNPHRLTWGIASGLPLAMGAFFTTVAGMLFSRDRRSIPFTRETFLLLSFWVVCGLSTLWAAFYPAEAWTQFVKVSKIWIATYLTMMLFWEREKIHALLLVIALSLGFFGLKGGIWALATGAANQVLGPPGTFISGNTEIGLALNMTLPLLLFLRREEPRWWLRHLLLLMFVFSIVASLITYSRGALLGLIAVLIVLFWNSRAKWLVILVIAIGLPVTVQFLPPAWFQKMSTMKTYEEDASAMGRIHAWTIAYRIALDRPILGAGFRPFTAETAERYLPEVPPLGTDAHNIFFQVLAEHGITGLLLFAALLASTMASLRTTVRRGRRRQETAWMSNYAQMIEASFIAYLVSGFFLSLSYFDLVYHLIAIAVILRVMLREAERRAV